MSKVIHLPDLRNIPQFLRGIADEIEDEDSLLKPESMTICTKDNTYHLGTRDEKKAKKDAIFNMVMGLATVIENCVVENEDER